MNSNMDEFLSTHARMDEFLKCINVYAISSYNISSYIRKNGKYACVLDAMALITDREPCCLVKTLSYMLENYPCPNLQVTFSNGDGLKEKEIGMHAEALIDFLCHLPGRDSRYRLYKYSDAILKYLDGDPFLVNKIIEARQNEDDKITKSMKRKHSNTDDYKKKIAKIREFEMFIQENTTFQESYTPSPYFHEEVNRVIHEFYSNQEEEEEGDFRAINEIRREEVESFMYIEEARRLKRTDEISFNQVIAELGFEDDFFRRIKCYELGGQMKEKKGHKPVAKKGKKAAYIYTKDDLDEMREIVKNVYSEYASFT